MGRGLAKVGRRWEREVRSQKGFWLPQNVPEAGAFTIVGNRYDQPRGFKT